MIRKLFLCSWENITIEDYAVRCVCHTARKVFKYGVISGPYFPVFSRQYKKCRPEITPYLDTFHAVSNI